MMSKPRTIANPADARTFVTAGNARVTLSSKKTGARYTYRVKKVEDRDAFFVSLLTGADNDSDFTYIGMIDLKKGRPFGVTKASKLPVTAKPVLAFRYFCEQVLVTEVMPDALEVRHEGRCGRCDRALTVPESIDRGIGPECWGKMAGG